MGHGARISGPGRRARWPRRREVRAAVFMVLLMGSRFASAGGNAPVGNAAILAVEPARRDTLLVCTLHTTGLPDARSRETIASGLPSALVIAFSLQDAAGGELAETRIEVRVEPDLLAEAFLVRTPFLDLRAQSLDELATLLAHLGPLPVLPLRDVDPRQVVRLQTRLAIHPLAPAEIERVHALFGTNRAGGRENRQERSVGIGTLVRRLLGSEPDEAWISEQTSRTFRADTLGEAP